MANTYAGRNETLRELGYATYRAYLDSPLWTSIKLRVYGKHGRKCVICPKRSTELHHYSYSKAVLQGNDLDKIVPVCGGCHLKIEFKPSGEKRKLAEAQTQYRRMKPKTPKQPYQPKGKTATKKEEKRRRFLEVRNYVDAIMRGEVQVPSKVYEAARFYHKFRHKMYAGRVRAYMNGVRGHPTTLHLSSVPGKMAESDSPEETKA